MPLTQGPGLSPGQILNIRPSGHANPIFSEASDTVSTTTFEEIFSYTSTDDDTKITFLECSASVFGQYRVKVNGVIKRELYSTGSNPNVVFVFPEPRPLSSGLDITVEFKAARFINGAATHSTFTAMDGYIGP